MTQRCLTTRGELDSYLGDELPDEARTSVGRHLDSCPSCTAELERRTRLRAELRSALATPTPSGLEERVRVAVQRDAAPRPRPSRHAWDLAAAAAVLVAAVVVVYRHEVPRTPTSGAGATGSRPAPAAPDPVDLTIFDDATRIHVVCGIGREVPVPPPPERIAARLGPFEMLWPAVAPEMAGLVLVDAHVCPRVPHRKFGHVVLRSGDRIVSVLATKERHGALPGRSQPVSLPGLDRPIYEAERWGYQVDAVDLGERVAFVVSEHDAADRAFALRVLPQLAHAAAP